MLAAGLLVAGGATALAGSAYLDSVRQAERYLAAEHPSAGSIAAAARALDGGTSCRQPEIADDLNAKPPDIGDARARLRGLDTALSRPLHPASGVETQLRRMGSAAPYNREQPESPGDLLSGWIQAREASIFSGCGGWGALLVSVLQWLGLALLVAGLALVAFRFLRARWGTQQDAGQAVEADRLRTAAERFAAADRLAGAGDFAAALRELASAVATALGGEMAWDASPLTVRELFSRAGRLPELRPLLRGFEDAVYGHRPVTREVYEAAAAAAAPYRAGAARAA
ncbi:MAG TPA: hypothetical protein VF137_09610 [Candidatus Dormibacteraeota bacterium]